MFNGLMRKMVSEVVRDSTRAVAPVNGDGWVGFVCKECGAPLSVHRSTTTAKAVERSTRGWRVACTGCGVTEYYELGRVMVHIVAS
jgi:RNase P subunit RPR2